MARRLGLAALLRKTAPAPPPIGKTVLVDPFANPASGWTQTQSRELIAKYSDGRYEIAARQQGSTVVSDTVFKSPGGDFSSLADVTVEADVTKKQNSTARFGLACRYSRTKGVGYLGQIDTHGGWSVVKVSGGRPEQLGGPVPFSDAVKPGDATNRLRLDCQRGPDGTSIRLYANGQSVGAAVDSPGLPPGAVGMVVSNHIGRCCGWVAFDNLTISRQ